MDHALHFAFGTHPDHGIVAAGTANTPAQLAHWLLTREQFEPVPGTPGLYRLTNPDQDGQRRTHQAVHDLRRHGYNVQTDYSLDPATTPRAVQPAVGKGLLERRSRIAQAATTRSPQRNPALTTTPPVTGPTPPKPRYAPTTGATQSSGRRRRR